jgi:hypothetical protein
MAILKIPVTKAGKSAALDVDTDAIPQDMYALVVMEGLKAVLNARMSKVGAITKLEGEELDKAHAAAMSIATENLANLMASKLKTRATKAKSDIPRDVATEARRIGRELVKNAIRAAGGKPSHYSAADITKAADELIASDASILAKARENIENRATLKPTISLAGLAESPKLVAKAVKAAADKKANKTLSAKQAGLVAPRKSKPGAEAHTTH